VEIGMAIAEGFVQSVAVAWAIQTRAMSEIFIEVAIILLLVLINGVFAMTEIAVVSSRKARLKQMADQGDARARTAFELADSPNRFLGTVQVGITMVGVLAGAFGGATIARKVAHELSEIALLAPYANAIGIGVVVLAITYLSLVLGELVPKRLALNNPEGISRVMAGMMNRLAHLAYPLVRVLGASTDLVLRLMGHQPNSRPLITEDEVKLLLAEGLASGVFQKAESEMVEGVLKLDRLPVREIMTPRPKIIWINQEEPHDAIWHKIVASSHSHFPVYDGHRDNIVGVISVKSIYANLAAGIAAKTRDLMVKPLIVPESQMAIQLLESFKVSGRHLALVANEFGSIAGLVSLHDVMEAVMGDFPSQDQRLQPEARHREDGTWLIDALIDFEEVQRLLPQFLIPPEEPRDYQTLAGFIVRSFGRVPKEGETLEVSGHVFEIIDMDRHRVDKVLVIPPGVAEQPLTHKPPHNPAPPSTPPVQA
jgi:putative hemolysin